MYTNINNAIKVINAIKAQIIVKDKELNNVTNVRDYDRISEEIANLYIKMQIEAQQLANLAAIAVE